MERLVMPSPGINLYRSPAHPYHWVARSEKAGWLIFPAAVDGWSHRETYRDESRAGLQPVPLWMAFNTGLLEAVVARAA